MNMSDRLKVSVNLFFDNGLNRNMTTVLGFNYLKSNYISLLKSTITIEVLIALVKIITYHTIKIQMNGNISDQGLMMSNDSNQSLKNNNKLTLKNLLLTVSEQINQESIIVGLFTEYKLHLSKYEKILNTY